MTGQTKMRAVSLLTVLLMIALMMPRITLASGSTILMTQPPPPQVLVNQPFQVGYVLVGPTCSATLTFSSSPPGLNSSPLTFNACNSPRFATFSSAVPGTYLVTVIASGPGAPYTISPPSFQVTVSPPFTPPPVITLAVNPAQPDGTNGWYRSNVSVVWNVIPNGSNILNQNCPSATVTADTPGSTFSCVVTYQEPNGPQQISQSVTIRRDATPPVLTLPAIPPVEATGPSTLVTYPLPPANDNLSAASVVCTPAPGSAFSVGTTPVLCTATDQAGNSSTGTLNIVVQDTTGPAISNTPANMTVEAQDSSGATVTYADPTANDLVDGPRPVACSPVSGTHFPIASNTVTCTAVDTHGNTSTSTFTIDVQDTTAPVMTLPSDFTQEATGPAGAQVSYIASASDLVDGVVTPVCSPASGSTFPLGTTAVGCTATDAHNNSASGSFNVTVVDTTPPALDLPADQTAEATGASGAVVTFTASANDLVDGPVAISCDHLSGSIFPLGTTVVTCSATDARGNASPPGSFNITVQDTTPPALSLPADQTAEATGASGAVTFAASAADAVDGTLIPICSPASGSTFPLGTTSVSCTASDAHGNSASGSFNVTVQDTTPPTLTLPGDQTIGAANQSGAVVTYAASANDLVDGAVTPICSPASGSTFAVGTTAVSCIATDAAGNSASGSFNVLVHIPVVGAITAPLDPTLYNTAINTSVLFVDAGTTGTHTATWDWGDGATSAGVVTESNGSGSATGTHTYTTAGIYTIQVTIAYGDGAAGTSIFQYVVIYNPDGGFVTGGGWIDSPAGAYQPDPTLTGRANFGFVSKYVPGRQQPDGTTEFNFRAGNMNFHSTSYDWLVISGAKAQYRGVGTLNGQAGYSFILTGWDGQISGGGGVDKFRIKILDSNNNVVYDNQLGAPDSSDPTTALGGGSIQIHNNH